MNFLHLWNEISVFGPDPPCLCDDFPVLETSWGLTISRFRSFLASKKNLKLVLKGQPRSSSSSSWIFNGFLIDFESIFKDFSTTFRNFKIQNFKISKIQNSKFQILKFWNSKIPKFRNSRLAGRPAGRL